MWRDGVRVPLTAKACAVLSCLIDGAGQVFTKAAILNTVWQGTHVTPDNIRVLVREIWRALGDDARSPRLIRTMRRCGYEFIAPVSDTPPSIEEPAGHVFVGRAEELDGVDGMADASLQGTRSLVLMSGPLGIGKTALCDHVLQRAVRKGFVVARGQCVPSSTPQEPYGAILDAIHRLMADVPRVRDIIMPHAPALVQHLDAVATKPRRGGRNTSMVPRLLREIVAALEELAANTPLVLALEDVHWLDQCSLDVLGALARRHQASKLLVLCTSRPLDAFPDAAPLQRLVEDMEMTRSCVVLRMKPLTRTDVEHYAACRFEQAMAPAMAKLLNRGCGGHPLLLAAAADAIVERRRRVSTSARGKLNARLTDLTSLVSSVVGRILTRQLDRLTPEERRVVNAVSVLGVEFSVWQAALVTHSDAISVEQILDRLARRGEIIDRAGDTGSRRAQYWFTHRWYPEVLSDRTALGNAS